MTGEAGGSIPEEYIRTAGRRIVCWVGRRGEAADTSRKRRHSLQSAGRRGHPAGAGRCRGQSASIGGCSGHFAGTGGLQSILQGCRGYYACTGGLQRRPSAGAARYRRRSAETALRRGHPADISQAQRVVCRQQPGASAMRIGHYAESRALQSFRRERPQHILYACDSDYQALTFMGDV